MDKSPRCNVYVGARYIPIVVGEWDSSKQTEYEPLMVVYFSGTSYTSKKYVPKNIDIHNEEYWAMSADYNAQVAFYRNEVQHLINTDFPEFKEQIDKRTIAYQMAHVNIRLSNSNGDDTNDGINNPVKTFNRALEVANNNGSYDMRILIEDTDSYTCDVDTFSGTLHVVGNGASLNFTKKVAFYNAHVNFQNLTITCNMHDGFYFDNSFVLLTNVTANGFRFNVYSGSLETNNCVFGALRVTKAFVLLGNTTINGYNGMPYMMSIAESTGLITGSLVANDTYVNENTSIYEIVGSDIKLNCGCTFNGGAFTGLTKLKNNNSCIQGAFNRLYSLMPCTQENGGTMRNQRGYVVPIKGSTKTINNFMSSGYVTSKNGQKYLRFYFYDEYDYFNDINVTISSASVFFNGTNNSVTPEEVNIEKSASSVLIDIPLPEELVMNTNDIFVIRCSAITFTYL